MCYESEIRNIISARISLTEPISTFENTSNLQIAGMNSLSFMQVVVDIENHFEVEFTNEMMIMENAGTILRLCECVSILRGELHEFSM